MVFPVVVFLAVVFPAVVFPAVLPAGRPLFFFSGSAAATLSLRGRPSAPFGRPRGLGGSLFACASEAALLAVFVSSMWPRSRSFERRAGVRRAALLGAAVLKLPLGRPRAFVLVTRGEPITASATGAAVFFARGEARNGVAGVAIFWDLGGRPRRPIVFTVFSSCDSGFAIFLALLGRPRFFGASSTTTGVGTMPFFLGRPRPRAGVAALAFAIARGAIACICNCWQDSQRRVNKLALHYLYGKL